MRKLNRIAVAEITQPGLMTHQNQIDRACRAAAGRLSHASTSSCRLEEVARVRDHSDALCQLEPSDAHASMVTSSFHLDPRHFASVWDGRPPGGLYNEYS